ncbi:MAG: A/G-specific adenine glycosylase [Candidatus Saccharibacteria bacterium]|nr:A/G-specific adenine glycosylase [Candidatus Saccharibacteria bacterium]
MEYSEESISRFKESVWNFYQTHQRDLPWRRAEADGSYDPYKILVSEIMLQQTQVARVIPKFEAFLDRFPSFEVVADASLGQVLELWSGLGYNRRAKFLWQASQIIARDHVGVLPRTVKELEALPGIGHNTAAAILAYSYNQPEVFIETNIRTVFIYHFADLADKISDKQLLPLVAKAVDNENPREWYWALMDYGSHLKRTVGNLSKQSAHYQKQSTFKGSLRQIRGQVLRLLIKGAQTQPELNDSIADERLAQVLEDLTREQLIHKHGEQYRLR